MQHLLNQISKESNTIKSLSKYENNTLTDKVKIVMPEEFYNKVKYLCNRISQVEWSGVLLYSTEGSFKNLKNFIITLQDIIPMQKGSQTYTEYSFNEKRRDTGDVEDRHIDYVTEKPEALDWKIGMIHSHNFMNVFFSLTDWQELEENAENHNFYLSLICNNKMDFTAKIGFVTEAETEENLNFNAFDETGKKFSYIQKKQKRKYKEFFVIDTEIQVPVQEQLFDDFFTNAVEDIIKKADYKPPVTHYQHNAPGFKQRNHVPSNIPVYTAPSSPAASKPIETDEHTRLERFLIHCVTLCTVDISGIDTIKKAILREKNRGTFYGDKKRAEYLQKFHNFYLANINKYYPGENDDLDEITIKVIELILYPINNIPQFDIVEDLIEELESILEVEEEDLFDEHNLETQL